MEVILKITGLQKVLFFFTVHYPMKEDLEAMKNDPCTNLIQVHMIPKLSDVINVHDKDLEGTRKTPECFPKSS